MRRPTWYSPHNLKLTFDHRSSSRTSDRASQCLPSIEFNSLKQTTDHHGQTTNPPVEQRQASDRAILRAQRSEELLEQHRRMQTAARMQGVSHRMDLQVPRLAMSSP